MLERVRATLEPQRAALEARNRALRTRLTPAVAIDKPESHRREYRAFVLPNELRVLVASDPAADKAAAALCVDAGRLSEPKAIPGLAHFCEHMLFLGTEKYPVRKHTQSNVNMLTSLPRFCVAAG